MPVVGLGSKVRFELFDKLTPTQVLCLKPLLQQVPFEAGDVIVHENEIGEALYLIVSGRLEVSRGGGDQSFVLAELGPGQDFGVAALGRAKRTATVRAVEPTILMTLHVSDLEVLSKNDPMGAYSALVRLQLEAQIESMREQGRAVVDALEAQLDLSRMRSAQGSIMMLLVGLMGAYAYGLRLMLELVGAEGESTLVTSGGLAIASVIIFGVLRSTPYPMAAYGFTVQGWRKHVPEALLWTAAFLALVTLAKWVAIQTVPGLAGERLFHSYAFEEYGLATTLLYGLVYSLFCPVQEMIARGALQGSLHLFLTGRYVDIRAILLSTLLFGFMHLHLSLGFALIPLIPSVFWGVIYARQRSLLGVSISHIVVGLYVVFIMGFPTLGAG